MRLTLRQEWRPRALNSVLGFMDIKTGVTIVILFALVNKVAGVYGLIAIFNGGSLAQLSMYIYSVAALAVFTWGMKAVTEEDPRKSLYFAHIFVADHLLNTIWTAFFAIAWWVYNPHDGKRIANSAAQQDMMDINAGSSTMTDEARREAAQGIWNKEKGLAATVLIVAWLLKFYFAALIYSYAIHLRKGSYRSLPLTNPIPEPSSALAPFISNADDYELSTTQIDVYSRRGMNGTRIRDASSSSQIFRDLEAPMESVLWDDEEELDVRFAPAVSNKANGEVVAGTESTASDGESERGDIGSAGGSFPRRVTRAAGAGVFDKRNL